VDEFLAARPEGAAGPAGPSLDPLELLAKQAPVARAAAPAHDAAPDLSSAYVPPRIAAADPRLITETIPAARLRQMLPDAGAPPSRLLPLEPTPPSRAVPGTDATPVTGRLPGPGPVAVPDRPGAPLSEFFAAPAVPAPVGPQVAPPTAGRPATPEELWAAFQEGAGVGFVPPQGLNPDLMRIIGTLLRHTIEGTRRLVAARAATKQELRADVTIVQPRNNNPLKFAPDAQGALEQLLQPPLRGFLPGPEAVEDVMDDLLGHAIGTLAGMRAALDGVLARFAPDQLEAKLVGHSVLDTLLPMNRRAKLWELYLQHFEAVRNEAQDDFRSLFGKAFLQAYEQQIDRLYAERRKP
jgi:FHA domain-containing protein